MKLQDQVVSLELSKKLKELGVKQESIFYWTHPWMEDRYLAVKDKWILTENYFMTRLNGREAISAFTVAELGEMLPFKYGGTNYLSTSKRSNGYWLVQYSNPIREESPSVLHKTLADAFAKMLIHLIEKGIVIYEGAEDDGE